MNEREAIILAGMEAECEKIRYAPAVKVGNTLYVSGQIGSICLSVGLRSG
jgi:enamine deaminase RidA (YjgF/YER057c/UK114 family)